MDKIKKLLSRGLLGFYDQVEITEIFACLPDKRVINVFTIIVAEDRNGSELEEAHCINNDRIKLSKLKNWSFGINRYTKSISDIVDDLGNLNSGKEWSASGKPLLFGNIESQPPKFISPDSNEHVPLNNVLKNNFWNGSYIFEWYDSEKSELLDLMNRERADLLQQLSREIQKYCPIALASVSDRLGNFIFQIPITILMARFCHAKQKNKNNLQLKIAWHPKNVTPRPLRLNCEMEHDKLINGYFSCEVSSNDGITEIPMDYGYGFNKAVLWDDENQVILAATRPYTFIGQIESKIMVQENEPRIFKIESEEKKIALVHPLNSSIGSKSSKKW